MGAETSDPLMVKCVGVFVEEDENCYCPAVARPEEQIKGEARVWSYMSKEEYLDYVHENSVSHTYCPACAQIAMAQFDEQGLVNAD